MNMKKKKKKVLKDTQSNMHGDATLAYLEALVCDKETLFSSVFSAYNVNHKMLRQIRENTGMDDETQKLHCIECALEDAKDEDKDNFRLALEAIISYAKDSKHSVEYYYNELRGPKKKTGYVEEPDQPSEEQDRFLEEPDRLLEKLKKWVPDLPLRKDNVTFFVMYCLNKYHATLYELKLIEKNAGHFKAEYTKAHKEAADCYVTNLKIITDYREKLEAWELEAKQPFYEEMFYPLDFDIEPDNASAYEPVIDLIRQYTLEYIRSRRTQVIDISINNLRRILRRIKKTALFPFQFLALCIRQGGSLFNQRLIGSDLVSDFEFHVYTAKPAICKQRLSRLSFLCQLCDTLCCNSKDVEKNLLYFIKYHGLRIDAPEEADQWETVLHKYNLMDSPVSLGLRYYRLKEECIPFRPERLLCYRNCSALHLGGLYSFMRRFPNYEDTYYLTSKIESSLKEDYLKQWSSESLEPDKVKELCSKVCKRLEWKYPEEIHKWMDEWEREDVSDVHLTRRPIDVDELKCLLIEGTYSKGMKPKSAEQIIQASYGSSGGKIRNPQ